MQSIRAKLSQSGQVTRHCSQNELLHDVTDRVDPDVGSALSFCIRPRVKGLAESLTASCALPSVDHAGSRLRFVATD